MIRIWKGIVVIEKMVTMNNNKNMKYVSQKKAPYYFKNGLFY